MKQIIKARSAMRRWRLVLIVGASTILVLLWINRDRVGAAPVAPKAEAKPSRVVEHGTRVKEFAEPKKVLTSEEIESGRW